MARRRAKRRPPRHGYGASRYPTLPTNSKPWIGVSVAVMILVWVGIIAAVIGGIVLAVEAL